MPRADMDLRSRSWIVVALSLLLAVVSVVVSPQEGRARSGGFSFKGVEKCFMRRINNARDRSGLSDLNRDRQLGYVARRHARKIARDRSIYHDLKLGRRVTRWRALGQNTGRGGSCKGLFRAFMDSSVHRSNILGPWRYIGVGVKKRNGNVYAQQVFESHKDPGNIYHYP